MTTSDDDYDYDDDDDDDDDDEGLSSRHEVPRTCTAIYD